MPLAQSEFDQDGRQFSVLLYSLDLLHSSMTFLARLNDNMHTYTKRVRALPRWSTLSHRRPLGLKQGKPCIGRVSRRAFLVSWAAQLRVLAHKR